MGVRRRRPSAETARIVEPACRPIFSVRAARTLCWILAAWALMRGSVLAQGVSGSPPARASIGSSWRSEGREVAGAPRTDVGYTLHVDVDAARARVGGPKSATLSPDNESGVSHRRRLSRSLRHGGPRHS